MADKEKFPVDLSGGGASAPTAGHEEFSLEPCTRAEEIGPNSSIKAPTAVLDGCAPKRREEEVIEEEGDDSDYEEHNAKIRARFAANVQKMFGSNPGVVWVDFPDCCVRPPGVEFPKPRPRRPDGQIDTAKEEEEELSGAVVTPPVST